jgi:hypothetical protein
MNADDYQTSMTVRAGTKLTEIGDIFDKTPLTRPVAMPGFDMRIKIDRKLLPYPEKLTRDIEAQVVEALEAMAEVDAYNAAQAAEAATGGEDDNRAAPTTSLETRILLAVLDGRLDAADEMIEQLSEPDRHSLRRAAGIVRYLATS